jgi:hypothetical protein
VSDGIVKAIEAGCLTLGLVLALDAPAHAARTIFLEPPGVVGESNAPSHPDVIEAESIALAASGFSVAEPYDSTSPAASRPRLLRSFRRKKWASYRPAQVVPEPSLLVQSMAGLAPLAALSRRLRRATTRASTEGPESP